MKLKLSENQLTYLIDGLFDVLTLVLLVAVLATFWLVTP